MESASNETFSTLFRSVIDFLPNIISGLAVVLTGSLIAWFFKRLTIRLGWALRLERNLTRYRWGQDFTKADVRYGLYVFAGNLMFLVVFIFFLDSAFRLWRLHMLSQILEQGIFYLPKLAIALLAFFAGWLIAAAASRRVQRALQREEVPKATLVARVVHAVLILFFSAIALVELNVAKTIVVIGFTTVFVTLGAMAVVSVAVLGRPLVENRSPVPRRGTRRK